MWPLCNFSLASAFWLLLPLLLGLLTGWWIWANRPKLGFVGDGIDSVGSGLGSAFAGAGAVVGGAGAALAKGASSVVDAGAAVAGGAVDMAKSAGSTVVDAGAAVAGGAVDMAKSAGSTVAGAATGAVGAMGAVAAVGLTTIGIPAAAGDADDLLQLKGVGPKLNTLLVSLGITRFDQIAAWTGDDIAKVDAHLGNFKGRIVRESWVEQAGLLATGAIAAFEAKFGKLDSENT